MRKFLAAISIAALAANGLAANLDEGTNEIRFSGLLDFDTIADTLFDANIGWGYFVRDYVEVGLQAGIRDDDFGSVWSVGAFSEYNFEIDSPLYPYVGAALNISGADLKVTTEAANNTALELDLRAGLKYFITEDLALDSLLSLRVASDDLYPEGNQVENTDWRLLFGLRYYFDM